MLEKKTNDDSEILELTFYLLFLYIKSSVFSATAWNAVAVMFPGARPFCRTDDRLTG